ncbi:MAG: hypothetical protein DSY82_01090, partial [Flavobacteriia bacterium]
VFFASMFVKSNDLFYGFSDKGLELFDASGNPVTGKVSMEVKLWDAGTEVNQAPGMGSDQPLNQSGPNTGADENGVVHMVNDTFTYPDPNKVIEITIMHDGGTLFTVKIENISGSSSLPTPLAPGVWAVHGSSSRLFEDNKAAGSELEKLAEDGDNTDFIKKLEDNTGYFSPFAPGVFAIHKSNVKPIFSNNTQDRGDGLEALAEDGNPADLAASLSSFTGVESSGVFNTPDGSSSPGPLFPDNSYSFTFTAEEGDNLSFAMMLVQSNDLFYSFGENGISLFSNGTPKTGNFTSNVMLWDAGTEVNEFPGAGMYQPVRGGAASGPSENGKVMKVSDGFTYPAIADAIEVKIELQ